MTMSGTTARRRVLKVPVDGVAEHRADLLAAEEPLEIRVDGEPLTVTMRTPGDDIDLAAYANPPLTTIRQSFEDTGRRAVLHLLAQIANPDMGDYPELVAPTLIIRGSTAPPR